MSTGGTRLWCNSVAAVESQDAMSAHAQLNILRLSVTAIRDCSLLKTMPDIRKLKYLLIFEIIDKEI